MGPPAPRRSRKQREFDKAWHDWQIDNPLYEALAYQLDDYLPADGDKRAVIKEFFQYIWESPKLRDKGQYRCSGTIASLPSFAVAWLDSRFQVQGYGSDSSEDAALRSCRRSDRTKRPPDPLRMYGSSSSRSPTGGTPP